MRTEGPGTGPMTSLNAATANGNGKTCGDGRAYASWGLQVSVGGDVAPTDGVITLHLSLDGTSWSAAVATHDIGDDTEGDIEVAVDKPAVYARAVLASLTGGTNPTVTAKIVGV